MSETNLEQKAIGDNKELLEKVLYERLSIMANCVKLMFGARRTFDFERKCLISENGKFVLQWREDGSIRFGTNQGGVK